MCQPEARLYLWGGGQADINLQNSAEFCRMCRILQNVQNSAECAESCRMCRNPQNSAEFCRMCRNPQDSAHGMAEACSIKRVFCSFRMVPRGGAPGAGVPRGSPSGGQHPEILPRGPSRARAPFCDSVQNPGISTFPVSSPRGVTGRRSIRRGASRGGRLASVSRRVATFCGPVEP